MYSEKRQWIVKKVKKMKRLSLVEDLIQEVNFARKLLEDQLADRVFGFLFDQHLSEGKIYFQAIPDESNVQNVIFVSGRYSCYCSLDKFNPEAKAFLLANSQDWMDRPASYSFHQEGIELLAQQIAVARVELQNEKGNKLFCDLLENVLKYEVPVYFGPQLFLQEDLSCFSTGEELVVIMIGCDSLACHRKFIPSGTMLNVAKRASKWVPRGRPVRAVPFDLKQNPKCFIDECMIQTLESISDN